MSADKNCEEVYAQRPFANINEFFARSGNVNKKVIEALICAGCLDGLYPYRKSLQQAVLNLKKEEKKLKRIKQQDCLFPLEEIFSQKNIEAELGKEDFLLSEKLTLEKNYLGYFRSGHPADVWRQGRTDIVDTQTVVERLSSLQNAGVKMVGMVENVQHRTTKKTQEPMVFFDLSDRTGKMEMIMFPKLFKQKGDLILSGKVLEVSGKISVDKVLLENVFEDLALTSGKNVL